jgi:hypothetical protein
MGGGPPDLLKPLVEGKRWTFTRVLQNGHDDAIEEPGTALNQIQVAQGQGVKASRVKGAHRSTLFLPPYGPAEPFYSG